MRNNKHSMEYDGELNNSYNWRDAEEWGNQEDVIHAKKKHQSHRSRHKGVDNMEKKKYLSEDGNRESDRF